jgi:hypothetical protein
MRKRETKKVRLKKMNCSLFGTLPGSLFPESLGKGVVVNLQLGDLELKYYCGKTYCLDHLGLMVRTLSPVLL